MSDLLYAWYGDDFTGSTDVLESLAEGGVESVLFLVPPTAELLGRFPGARAIGLANGSNPIAIVVPCHRVIGADASLTGYGGGRDRKRWLLAHEQAHCAEADVGQYRMAL